MKKSKLHFVRSVFVLFSIIAILLMAACSSSSNTNTDNKSSGNNDTENNSGDDVITLKAATAIEINNLQNLGFPIFQELVKEKSNGKVVIEYVGGPEAIPAFNQGEALANGTLDIAWVASSYYAEMIPETLVTNFTEFTYEEERENGAIEYLSSLHEKEGLKLIGRAAKGKYKLYMEKKVETMEDFKGLRVRGTSTYVPLLEALGADAISMPGGEIYSSLEKGLIDGTAWASFSVTDLGLQELVNYEISPAFNTLDTLIVGNLDKWNSLPQDVQDIIQEAAIESYYGMAEELEKHLDAENKKLEEAGVEVIEMPNPDEFTKLALDASWEWLAKRVDNIEELEKYFRKQ